jgi:predicted kinase
VDPIGLGGPQGGPLQVLCKTCNSARQDRLPPPKIVGFTLTLVAGPPCGGKNTYIRERAGLSDLVVDYDALAVALQVSGVSHGHVDAHKPLVCEARDAVLERLRLGGHGIRQAWLIASAPKRKDRQRYRQRYGAQVVVVVSPEDVCLRRGMGQRPREWFGYVQNWFRDYEPDPADEIVQGYTPGGL